MIQSSLTADQEDLAILAVLSHHFQNRGIKKVDWLYNANEAKDRGYPYRLVEVAFIDNDEDMTIFENKKEELAKGLVSAITQEEVKTVVSATPSNQGGQPNSSTSPVYHVGDSVRVLGRATHYQTGQAIANWVKGRTYKILQIKVVNQSQSKRAYLLEGIKSWVLEQDVEGTSLAQRAVASALSKVGQKVTVPTNPYGGAMRQLSG